MPKQSGLASNFYVDGRNLSGDIGALGRIGGGLAGTQDVTGIDKEAFERIGLARDGAIEWTAFFNPDTGRAHAVLSTLPTADRALSYFHRPALGNPAASLVGKQINYDPARAADGSLTIEVQALANGFGLEWGNQLTAGMRTDGAPANGTGVDFGAGPTIFGAQFYLHVFAFTGTSAVIKIQESSDNGAVDPWADVTGGAFTSVTGITSERIQTARNQTVERWLRVVTTGTFTNVVFAVQATRNDVATVF